MGDIQPQDKDSGLVERHWVRKNRKTGQLSERTLEGKHVEATWLDRQGRMQRAAGEVIRNNAGQLVIESWADGIRRESAVTRDANIDVTSSRR